MIGGIPSVGTVLAQKFQREVAPTGLDEMKAKVARDTTAAFYAAPPKDVVETSVYNKMGQAPTVVAKIRHILDISV